MGKKNKFEFGGINDASLFSSLLGLGVNVAANMANDGRRFKDPWADYFSIRENRKNQNPQGYIENPNTALQRNDIAKQQANLGSENWLTRGLDAVGTGLMGVGVGMMNKGAGNMGNPFKKDSWIKAAYGANNPNAGMEVEGNEAFEDIHGNTGQFQGASHEEGGIDIPAPLSEKIKTIFSDRISIKNQKGKAETMAQRKLKREKQESGLEKRRTDDILAENSYQRNQETKQAEEDFDISLQEMISSAMNSKNSLEKMSSLPQLNPEEEVPENAYGYNRGRNNGLPPPIIDPNAILNYQAQAYPSFQTPSGTPINTYTPANNSTTASNNFVNSEQPLDDNEPYHTPNYYGLQKEDFDFWKAGVDNNTSKKDFKKWNSLDQQIIKNQQQTAKDEGRYEPNNPPVYNSVQNHPEGYNATDNEGNLYKLDEDDPNRGKKYDKDGNFIEDWERQDSESGIKGDGNSDSSEDGKWFNSGFMPTFGDSLGMLGNILKSRNLTRMTLQNRAGDVPNQNYYENFGKDSLKTMQDNKALVNAIYNNSLNQLASQANQANYKAGVSARSQAVRDGLQNVVQGNINNAIVAANNNLANQEFAINNQISQIQSMRDKAVSEGAYKRDENDARDRDNFYSQMDKNIVTEGNVITGLGGTLNKIQERGSTQNLVNNLSDFYELDPATGTLRVKKGMEKEAADRGMALLGNNTPSQSPAKTNTKTTQTPENNVTEPTSVITPENQEEEAQKYFIKDGEGTYISVKEKPKDGEEYFVQGKNGNMLTPKQAEEESKEVIKEVKTVSSNKITNIDSKQIEKVISAPAGRFSQKDMDKLGDYIFSVTGSNVLDNTAEDKLRVKLGKPEKDKNGKVFSAQNPDFWKSILKAAGVFS